MSVGIVNIEHDRLSFIEKEDVKYLYNIADKLGDNRLYNIADRYMESCINRENNYDKYINSMMEDIKKSRQTIIGIFTSFLKRG